MSAAAVKNPIFTVINPHSEESSPGVTRSFSDNSNSSSRSEVESEHAYDTSLIFDALRSDGNTGFVDEKDRTPLQRVLLAAVSPNNRYRLLWDVWILCLVVYSCKCTGNSHHSLITTGVADRLRAATTAIAGPYRLAFEADEPTMTAWEISVDVFFYLDIVVNFWTGFDRGYEVVMDKRMIVEHYLRGWFMIDLVATLNWDVVFETTASATEYDVNQQISGMHIRMMRLLKVLRLLRLGRLVNRISAKWQINTAFIDAVKFFFYVFMVCHLLACFFFLVPMLTNCDEDFGSQSSAYANSTAAQALQCSRDHANGTCDGSTAIGWFYPGACMQGSWRQQCEYMYTPTRLQGMLIARLPVCYQTSPSRSARAVPQRRSPNFY